MLLNIINILIFLVCLAISFLFGLFLISEFWVGVLGIPGAILLFILTFRYLKILTIIWITGTATFFIYANNFLQSIPFARVERLILVLLFLGIVIPPILNKSALKSFITIEKIMLILLLVLGLSTLTVSVGEPTEVIKENLVLYIKGFFLPYAAFFVARQINWSEKDVEILIKALLGAGVYLGLCGFLEYFFGLHFFYPKYLEVHITDRAGATFHQPTHYGMVMAAFLFIGLFDFVRSKDVLFKVMQMAVLGVIFLGLILSKTRGPWLAALVGLFYIYFKDHRLRGILTVAGFSGGLAFFAAIPYMLSTGLLQDRILTLETMFPRVANYATSLNMIAHNPVFGLGFGRYSFSQAKDEFATTFGIIPTQYTLYADVPHNEFLHIFVLSGLTGFIPFMLVLFWIFKLSDQNLYLQPGFLLWQSELAPYVRAIAITYVIASIFVDTLYYRYFLMLMYFMLGILVSYQPQSSSLDRRVLTSKQSVL